MNNYTVLVSPFLLGGQLSVQNFEKLAGLWFTRGITTQVDTMKDYLEVQKNLQGCVLLGRGQYPGRHYEGLSGGPKKLAGLRLTRGISTQVDTEGLSPEKAV